MRPLRRGAVVYKLLLCFHYLRTRFLAFLCVGSVMLGVATLIVVNSVMAGFSDKLRTQLNGLSSDVTVSTHAAGGFPLPPEEIEARLRASAAGKYVENTSHTVETFAVLQFTFHTADGPVQFVEHVKLIGIDPARHAAVGSFAGQVVHSKDDVAGCFAMTTDARRRNDARRDFEARERAWEEQRRALESTPPKNPKVNAFGQPVPQIDDAADAPAPPVTVPALPPDAPPRDPPGIILGWDLAYPKKLTDPATGAAVIDPDTGRQKEEPRVLRGDDVFVATVGASGSKPVTGNFVVTDYSRSGSSEVDSKVAYVPLAYLQHLCGMDGKTNHLHVKLTEDIRQDAKRVHSEVVPAAAAVMPEPAAFAESWWQQQGMMLNAIDIERGLLNFLLFLIIGVAGFGVLAIFSMIVSEKVRDIGVMKSLGASGGGVMGIFLGYGVLLGLVGGVLGTALGVYLTENINAIERAMTALSGQQLFDRKVYMFDKIPTHLDAVSVLLVNAGAVGIAVLSSVIPALRAARLQPVRALRFE